MASKAGSAPKETDWSALEPCVALLALQGVSCSIGSTWLVESPASELIKASGSASEKWMKALIEDGSFIEHAKPKSMGHSLARFIESLGCQGGRLVGMSIQTGESGGSCLWIEMESEETYPSQKKADKWAKQSAAAAAKALEEKGVASNIMEMNMDIPDEDEFVSAILARRRSAWERSAINEQAKQSAASAPSGKARL